MNMFSLNAGDSQNMGRRIFRRPYLFMRHRACLLYTSTGEETISYWFDLPIDVAEFEEKLGVGAESGDYRCLLYTSRCV